ncbi:MAG: hypothetical protein IJ593_09370 [Lachnospiraceae bacterium]|nr:hypothetical protein [Lachnospiraceae bacterium]
MDKKEEVLKKISIPDYFDKIIVPQLGSYYSEYPVNFDVRPVVCCPLHDENTPSMRYYEETNSFYCFGCRKGGDVINLHRLFTERQTASKPSFAEAVEFLYNYFIKGNDNIQPVKVVKHLVHNEQLSNNVELGRYAMFISGVEKQLEISNDVTQKNKNKIYKEIDDIDILLGKNEINATDAVEYIRNLVKTIEQSQNV